jgi:hypothetical protein
LLGFQTGESAFNLGAKLRARVLGERVKQLTFEVAFDLEQARNIVG